MKEAVIAAGRGQVPGRQTGAVKGGIPHTIPVVTINKVCGSALKAVTIGTQMIKCGDADVVVCGGMESMSNAPYLVKETRWGARMNNAKMKDAWCRMVCGPENDVHMAMIGGAVAGEYIGHRTMGSDYFYEKGDDRRRQRLCPRWWLRTGPGLRHPHCQP